MRELALLALLGLFHQSAGQSCQVYYEIMPLMKVTDGAMQAGVGDVGSCQTACEAGVDCLGFDFTDSSECFLIIMDNALISDANANHYTRQQACEFGTTSERCFYDYQGQSTTTNSQLGPLRGEDTVENCLLACLTFENCGGVVFNTTSNLCSILVDPVTNYTAETDQTLYTFFNCSTVPFNTVCEVGFTLIPDTKIVGGMYIIGNDTAMACQATCEATPGCFGFDFNIPNTDCFLLFDATVPLTPDVNVDHYVCEQTCMNSNECTYRCTGAYAPADSVVFQVAAGIVTLEECLGVCNENTMCTMATFNTELNFDCRIYTTTIVEADLEIKTGLSGYTRLTCSTSTTDPPTVPPGTCIWRYDMFTNQKAQGANLLNTGNPVADCQGSCTSQATCTGLDFQTTNMECWLHTGTPYPTLQASSGNNEDHYDKFRQCGDCEFGYYPERLGGSAPSDVQLSITTPDECVLGCGAVTSCRSASFNTAGTSCYFYSDDRVSSATSVATSNHFVKTMCANEFDGCSFKYVPENERKIAGGDQVPVTPSTSEQCEVQCNARQGCFGFDFNSANECFLLITYGPIVSEVGVVHNHLRPSCNGTDRTDCEFFATGTYWPTVSGTQSGLSREECFTTCYDGTVVGCTGIAYDNNVCYTFGSTADWTDANLVSSSISTLEAFRFDGCANTPPTPTPIDTTTTSMTPTPTDSGCVSSWEITPDMHSSGGIAQGEVADFAACRQLCLDNPDCVGIDVETGNSPSCWLHLNPHAPNTLTPATGVNFHALTRCTSTSSESTTSDTTVLVQECNPEYEEVVGMKKGGGSPNAGANTLEMCEAACEAAFTCTGFDYTDQNACWLHSNVDANLVPQGGNEVVSHYIRKWRCGGCLFVPFHDFNAPGGNPQPTRTTEETCLVGCAAEATCFAVDFQDSTSSCFFFTSIIPRASLNIAQGVRHWMQEVCDTLTPTPTPTPTGTDSTPTPTGSGVCTPTFRVYPDNRVQGAQLVVSVTDLAGCMGDCEADPNCLGFDFVTSQPSNNCWKDTTGLPLMDAQGAGIDHYVKALQCGDCKYEWLRGLQPSADGTDRAENTRDTCLLACEDDGACFAATFDTTNTCRFFGAGSRDTIAPAAGVDFYDEYECTEVCMDDYRLYPDMKVSGAMQAPNVATLQGCIDECDASTTCRGFDFTDGNSCWLDNVGLSIVGAGSEGVDHYVKSLDCGDCFYECFPGKSPSGSGTTEGFDNIGTCLGACSRGPCVAATFDTTNNECTFYQQVATTLVDSTANYYEEYDCSSVTPTGTGSTTSSGGSTPPLSECIANYDVSENNQVFGGTPVTAATTVLLCQDACQERSACVGFDFNSDDNSCWLTVGVAEDIRPASANVDHYSLYYQCGDCRFDLMPDFSAPGGSNMGGTLNFAECLLLCEGNANCVAVDFSNGVCSMFTSTPNPQPTPGTIHWTKGQCTGTTGMGGSTQPPVSDCVPAYTTVEGQKVNNGVEQGGVNDVAGCTSACEFNDFCIGFDFDRSTSGCWLTVDSAEQLVPQNNNEDVVHYNRIWTCNGCSFRPFSRRGAAGGMATSDTSAADCVRSCSTSSGCFDALFDFTNDVCRNFDTDVTPSVSGTTYREWIHWQKDGVCPGSGTTSTGGTTSGPPASQCVVAYIETLNVNLPGGIAEPGVNTVDGCKSACEANVNDCIGFDFDGLGVCWLHGNELIGINPGSLTGNTRYELVYNCGGCRYQPYPGRRFAGNGVNNRAETGRDDCLFACNPNPFNQPNPACTNINLLTGGGCSHSNIPNTVTSIIVDSSSTHLVRLDCGEVSNDNGGSTASTTSRTLTTTTMSTSTRGTTRSTRSTTTTSTERPTTATQDQTTTGN